MVNRYVGNPAPIPGVFPDYPAPVIRNSGGELEMTMMCWGMPPPPRTGGPPVTNIRTLARLAQFGEPLPYPGQQLRLVRAGAAPPPETKKKDVVWFELTAVARPSFCGRGPRLRKETQSPLFN